jgi:hypothetical protein
MNAWAWVGAGIGAWFASNALLAWFMIATGRRDPAARRAREVRRLLEAREVRVPVERRPRLLLFRR